MLAEKSIPKPTNNLVTPLLTDLYQITMAYGYWKNNKHNDEAVFELFYRKTPFKGSFAIFCGIDEVVSFLHHFQFTPDDIAYLKTTPSLCHCEEEFFQYLGNLDCSEVEIRSLQQGTIAFPREPMITVSGPLIICQLLETTILNLVNFSSLVATNAARMVIAARGQYGEIKVKGKDHVPKCIEYGLRRAQGPDGGFSASKYCIVGGFDGTANVQVGKLLGAPIYGTHAHAFVQSHCSLEEVAKRTIKSAAASTKNNGEKKMKGEEDVELLQLVLKHRKELGDEYLKTNDGELAAFIAYAIAFPKTFLALVDTYNTLESGIKNFIVVALALYECGYSPIGIRLDSGDLGQLSLECQKIFEDVAEKLNLPFFKTLTIIASDSINEKKLADLNEKGHAISAFGIGTHLVTCQAQPALGCVFKLVELNGEPRIKLSNDPVKVLIPKEKRVFRLYDDNGTPEMDVLVEKDDDIPMSGVEITLYETFATEPIKKTPKHVEEILQTVWDKKNGSVCDILSLMDARASVEKQIRSLNPSMVKLTNPTMYKVMLTEKLQKDWQLLIESQKVRRS